MRHREQGQQDDLDGEKCGKDWIVIADVGDFPVGVPSLSLSCHKLSNTFQRSGWC